MKKIKFTLLVILLVLANITKGQSHIEMLKNASVIDQQECEKERGFKQSICSFKDVDTVRYMYINNSPVHDFKSVKEDIDKAVKETFRMAEKVAIKDTVDLDLVIRFEYLDGIGGTLAKAHYPSCNPYFIQVMTFDNYDVPPGRNTPDSLLIYYKNIKDIGVITRHEMGHILGRMHEDELISMMNPYYNSLAEWSKDDSLFFELNFGATDFIRIHEDDSFRITPNFNISEFFTTCKGHEYTWLDKRLIVAAQKLRVFYGSPIYVSSTARDHKCNARVGGSSKSYHLACRAADLVFADKAAHIKFLQDVNENNYIIKVLESTGIGAIGLYNKHIHIDTRSSDLIIFDKTSSITDKKNEDCGL